MTSSNFIRRIPTIGNLIPIVFVLCTLYSLQSFIDNGEKIASAENIVSKDKRFVDNKNNTITDTKTGLMWIKQDSYLHTKRWLNWFQAKQYIKKLNEERYANHNDWQIPTLEELRSIFEPRKFNSAQLGREMKIYIDPIFAKNGVGTSWSAKENGRFNAFGIIFNNGRTFSHPKVAKSRKAVRALRHITAITLK